MSNTTVPNLPMATSLSGAEQIGIVQAGTSCRATLTQIAAIPQTTPIVFPSYTTAQKNALSTSVGSVVFDSTLSKLSLFTGGGWQTITSV